MYDLEVEAAAAAPIVVGYANGCIGYVPTEAEFPWGGYEVCHAFRVYGQPAMLARASA